MHRKMHILNVIDSVSGSPKSLAAWRLGLRSSWLKGPNSKFPTFKGNGEERMKGETGNGRGAKLIHARNPRASTALQQ